MVAYIVERCMVPGADQSVGTSPADWKQSEHGCNEAEARPRATLSATHWWLRDDESEEDADGCPRGRRRFFIGRKPTEYMQLEIINFNLMK
jgi:hypothetical protein